MDAWPLSDDQVERLRCEMQTHRDMQTRRMVRSAKKPTRRVIRVVLSHLPQHVRKMTSVEVDELLNSVAWESVQGCRGVDLGLGLELGQASISRVQFELERWIFEVGRYVTSRYLDWLASIAAKIPADHPKIKSPKKRAVKNPPKHLRCAVDSPSKRSRRADAGKLGGEQPDPVTE